MCDLDFDEYATVWDEHLVSKARKEHDCDSCGGAIGIGDSYVAHFSVFDGNPNHEKQCLRCRTISNAFHREHGTSVNPGSLLDYLVHCLDEEIWADDGDEDETKDGRPSNRHPSRLSDEGLRWKYAMVEIRARNAAALEAP
jgi:hypothetical protein